MGKNVISVARGNKNDTQYADTMSQANSGNAWTFSTPIKSYVTVGSGIVSKYLVANEFGFKVPNQATMTGLVFTVSRSGNSNIYDDQVSVITSGVIRSTDKARTGAWDAASSGATYGSSTDKWALASNLTPDIVNRKDFGVALRVTSNANTWSSSSTKNVVGMENNGTGRPWTIDVSQSGANISLASGVSTTYLIANEFGFEIPTTSAIDGVIFTISRSGQNDVYDSAVRIVVSGVVQSQDKARTAKWLAAGSGATYGTSTSKWGLSSNLTPDVVNADNFGVALKTVTYANALSYSSGVPPTGLWQSGAGYSWTIDTPSLDASRVLASGWSTKYLRADNFAFNVPSGVLIDGVQFTVSRSGYYDVYDEAVRLVVSGVVQSTDKSRTAAWLTAGSGATYGSSTDRWGMLRNLTSDVINRNDFGVALKVNSPNGSLSSTSSVSPTGLFVSSSGSAWTLDVPSLDATSVLESGLFTEYLRADAFDFSIPSGAHINGVTFTVSRSGSADIYDEEVKLVVSGVIQSEDKKRSAVWLTAGSGATYGSATDRWSLDNNLTSDVVNRDDFGLAFKATNPNASGNVAWIYDVAGEVSYSYGGIPYVYNVNGTVYYSYGGIPYVYGVSAQAYYSNGGIAYVNQVGATAYYTFSESREGRAVVYANKFGNIKVLEPKIARSTGRVAWSGKLGSRFEWE